LIRAITRFRALLVVAVLLIAGHVSPTVNYYEALISLSAARTLRVNGLPRLSLPFYSFAMYCAPNAAQIPQARAAAHSALNDYSSAIEDLDTSLMLDPSDPVSWADRAWVYSRTGNNEEALRDYTEAVRLRPDDADEIANKALIEVRLKSFDLAIADYTEAIRLKPGDPKHFYRRGHAYMAAQNPKAATADLDHAIALAPEGHTAGSYYYWRAEARASMGDKQGALGDLDRGEGLACEGVWSNLFCGRCFKSLRATLEANVAHSG
jgi:tetratricopeptide (TPR) repeat protein